jgi:hypothetical protein
MNTLNLFEKTLREYNLYGLKKSEIGIYEPEPKKSTRDDFIKKMKDEARKYFEEGIRQSDDGVHFDYHSTQGCINQLERRFKRALSQYQRYQPSPFYMAKLVYEVKKEMGLNCKDYATLTGRNELIYPSKDK